MWQVGMALYFALASVIYHVIIVVIHVCNISTSVDSRAYHKSKFYIFGYNIDENDNIDGETCNILLE